MKLSRLNEDAIKSSTKAISKKQPVKEGILTKDEDTPEFLYRMLDRLRSDCDYYLGNGNRNEKFLWAKTVDAQIEEMRDIYNKLKEKPEWLTDKDIDEYEREMKSHTIAEGTTTIDLPTNKIDDTEFYTEFYIYVPNEERGMNRISRVLKDKFGGEYAQRDGYMWVYIAPDEDTALDALHYAEATYPNKNFEIKEKAKKKKEIEKGELDPDDLWVKVYDLLAPTNQAKSKVGGYLDDISTNYDGNIVIKAHEKDNLNKAIRVANKFNLNYKIVEDKYAIEQGKYFKYWMTIYVYPTELSKQDESVNEYNSKEDNILIAATKQIGKKLSDLANQLMSVVGEIINDSNLRSHLTKEDRDKIFEVHDILNTLAREASSGAVTLTDSLKEDVDSDAIVSDLSNSGIASIIIGAINDEWEAIDYYNSMIVTAESEGKSDVANIANDILKEENIHVGQLQKLLSMINPETEAIADGEDEAEELLSGDNSEEENLEECKSTLSEDEDKQLPQHLDEFFTFDNVEFHIRESKGRIYITSIRPYDLSDYSFAVSKDDGEQFSIYRDGKFIEQFSPSTFEEDEESGIKNFNWNEVARELLRLDKDIEQRIDHT